MASVHSLSLIDENITTTTTTDTQTLEIGHCNFIAQLVVSNWNATTLDVAIQHSPDGTNWYTVDSFAQATGNTTELIQLEDGNGIPRFMLPRVRAVCTLAGTDTDVKVTLHYDRQK